MLTGGREIRDWFSARPELVTRMYQWRVSEWASGDHASDLYFWGTLG
jgi:hypothetical protein